MPEKSVVESLLDGFGTCAVVGKKDRIEASLMEKLQPHHVELHARGTTPLTSFQDDDVDRLAVGTEAVEECDQLTLRII